VSASTIPSNKDISKQAVKGTLWTYVAFAGGKLLTFVSTLILARLLSPEQFGIVGYCLIVIYFLDTFNTFGVGTALISRRDRLEEAANAAFWISIGSSALLCAIAWVAAPFIAGFFDEPLVTDLVRTLMIAQLIAAVGAVPNALSQRHLKFKVRLIPELGRALTKGGVSVLMALMGYGVWSLVYGQIAGEIFTSVALWVIMRWRPTALLDGLVSRQIFAVGGHAALATLIGIVQANIDYILIGRMLGSAPLGLYMLAFRIPDLVIRNFNWVTQKVAHPILAQLQSDPSRLSEIYLKYLRYITLITVPAGVGIALIAQPFIETFYTPEWLPAVFPMQMIALALAIQSAGYIPGVLYKAINRPDIINRLAPIKLTYATLILWAGTRWGISGVALGQILVSSLDLCLDCWMASRVVATPLPAIGRAILPAAAAALLMAAVVLSVGVVLPLSGLAALLTICLLGGAAYAGAVALVSRETAARAGAMFRQVLARS
jgi:O-antigen/teichoic acid export membrane protein